MKKKKAKRVGSDDESDDETLTEISKKSYRNLVYYSTHVA